MKVKALREFNDQKAKTKRRPGDVFTVSKARYDEIMAYMPDLIAECEEEPAEAAGAKAQPRKRTTKAAKRGSAK